MMTRTCVSLRRIVQVAVCAMVVSGAAVGQSVIASFDGDKGPGQAVCDTGVAHCAIPDMDAGTNGKVVVQADWQNFQVYDYAGKLLQSTPMKEFIQKAGLNPIPEEKRKSATPVIRGPIEPHVVFDEFIQRWIVTVTGVSDSLIVSATADPRGAWHGVNLACLQGGPCLDYDPAVHVGFDRNGVYYCGGHIGEDSPNTIVGVAYDCFAVSSAEAAGIGAGNPPTEINRAHNMPLDIMPAIDHTADKKADAPAYFVTKTCTREVMGGCQNAVSYSFEWIVDSFTWNGKKGTYHEQLVKTEVGSKENRWLYSKPCCGAAGSSPQKGSEIELRGIESHRLANLVQWGPHLQGVMGSGPCTKDCGTHGVDKNNVLLWFDLDCTKPDACVVSQTAKLGGGDFNVAYATVGIDKAGNTGIVANSWNAETDLSVVLWTRKRTDAPNTFRGPETVVKGTQPYVCDTSKGISTIGNAGGILTALDPSDGSRLWTTEQWGNDAGRCVWTTRIVSYRIEGKK